mmetsp:Transcript_35962/g.106302  ORF Transcript_35962/g.106302 Transcript_35962/m.106302 type:complete len:236 (+) Transcript_35962:567-1274(+)
MQPRSPPLRMSLLFTLAADHMTLAAVRTACQDYVSQMVPHHAHMLPQHAHRSDALLAACSLALARGLALDAARLELVCNGLLADLLSLLAVHSLHQHTLVLEHVTLDPHVKLVVQVLVDLLRVAVLLEQTAQNAHAANPQHLRWQAGLTGTTALAVASATSLGLGLGRQARASAGVDLGRLPDDETVLDKLPHILPGVGHGNFIDLIGVKPDLPLAAPQHRGCKPLLQLERHHRA